jgi:transcriptional regulator
MLYKYENHRKDPVLLEKISPALVESELKGIVGFKIKIQEIQAAYKLSQNRSNNDYKNIIENLYAEKDLESHQLAETMKKLKS